MRHVYKTSDLAPEKPVEVERLISRTLENDEAVELIGRRTPAHSGGLTVVIQFVPDSQNLAWSCVADFPHFKTPLRSRSGPAGECSWW